MNLSKYSKIAIIIPVYNEEDIILDTLRSFVGQRLSPSQYQLIIVDNGSTDSSIRLIDAFIKSHPSHSISLVREVRRGSTYATRKGFSKARAADILIRIDADTIIPATFLSTVSDYFLDSQVDAIVGRFIFPWEVYIPMSSKNRFIYGLILKKREIIRAVADKFYGPLLQGPFYAVTRNMYERSGGIPLHPSVLLYGDDVAFGMNLLLSGANIHRTDMMIEISPRRFYDAGADYLTGKYYWENKATQFRHDVQSPLQRNARHLDSGLLETQLLEVYTDFLLRCTAYSIWYGKHISLHEAFIDEIMPGKHNENTEMVSGFRSAKSVYNFLHKRMYQAVFQYLHHMLHMSDE